MIMARPSATNIQFQPRQATTTDPTWPPKPLRKPLFLPWLTSSESQSITVPSLLQLQLWLNPRHDLSLQLQSRLQVGRIGSWLTSTMYQPIDPRNLCHLILFRLDFGHWQTLLFLVIPFENRLQPLPPLLMSQTSCL